MPVHPDDRPLLGMKWEGQCFLDSALPFGLRSAPKVFNALADGLLWVLKQQGVRVALHYLDDYLICGAPRSRECSEALEGTLRTCERLGVPVSKEKLEGPTTSLSFLGITVDMIRRRWNSASRVTPE